MLVWGAFFLLAVFCVAVSSYAINNRSKLERLETQFSEKLVLLQRELDSVGAGTIGLGQNLINIEKKLNVSLVNQERLSSAAEYQPYGQAEVLASQGVKADQLSERFGLSESEAQLMSMLQKRSSAH